MFRTFRGSSDHAPCALVRATAAALLVGGVAFASAAAAASEHAATSSGLDDIADATRLSYEGIIEDYIVESQGIDEQSDDHVKIVHGGDYVTFTGPCKIKVLIHQRKRHVAGAVWETDNRSKLIGAGEEYTVTNDETSEIDKDIVVTLMSAG